MIPYKADVPMQRWPLANWVIIGLTVVVSLVAYYGVPGETAMQFAVWRPDLAAHIDSLNAQAGRTVIDAEEIEGYGFHSYQLVTGSLLHDGLLHLFGNMVFLFVFGNAVNAKIGHPAYVGLYVAFAIITSAAWCILPGDGMLELGASGAVMGIAGMFMVLYPLNEISVFTMFVYRPIVFHWSAVWVLLIYFAGDVLGFLSGGDGVARISHLAGTVSGAGLTGALVFLGQIRPGPGEKTLLEVLGMKVKREGKERPPVATRSAAVMPTPPQMIEAGAPRTVRSAPGGMNVMGARRPPVPASAQDELPPIEIDEPAPTEDESHEDAGLIELEPPPKDPRIEDK